MIQRIGRSNNEPVLHAVGLAYDINSRPIHGGGVTSLGKHYDETRIYMAPHSKQPTTHLSQLVAEDPGPVATIKPSSAVSDSHKRARIAADAPHSSGSTEAPTQQRPEDEQHVQLRRRDAVARTSTMHPVQEVSRDKRAQRLNRPAWLPFAPWRDADISPLL